MTSRDGAGAATEGSPARLGRLLALLSSGGTALALTLQLFLGGAAADLAEPSLNLAVSGIVAAVLVIAGLRAAVLGRAALPGARLTIPVALLVATAAVSLAGADDLWAGLRRTIGWATLAGLLGLVQALLATGRSARASLLALVLALGAVLAGLALDERLRTIPEARAAYAADRSIAEVNPEMEADFRARLLTDQASGPFVIPNGLGACFAVTGLAGAGLALALGKRARVLGGVAWGDAAIGGGVALGLLAATGLAAQKGAYLGLAAGALFATAVAAVPRRPRLALGLAGALALAATGVAIAVALTPVERLERLPGGLSIAVRKEYATTALRMAAEAPVRGVGAGSFAAHSARLKPERGEETRFAHDDYLEVLAEQGPLGLLALVAMWAALLMPGALGSAGSLGELPQRTQSAQREPSTSGSPDIEARKNDRTTEDTEDTKTTSCTSDRARPRSASSACSVAPSPHLEAQAPPTALPLATGAVLALALLPLLGLRYRDPWVVAAAAAGAVATYVVLRPLVARAIEAAPDLVAWGARAGAAAFAAQAAIDFLHVEAGLLWTAVTLAGLAAAIEDRPLAAERALGGAMRATLPLGAAAAFVALVLGLLPRAILADGERLEAERLLRRGLAVEAVERAQDAVEALPIDIAARVLLGDALAEVARRTGDPRARTASADAYRRAIGARRGLADVKARLAALLPGAASVAAYESAAAAYPGNPRYRFLAGRALAATAEPAARGRAQAHLAAALRIDPIVRHDRLRLSPEDRAAARALLDSLNGPAYNAREPREEAPR